MEARAGAVAAAIDRMVEAAFVGDDWGEAWGRLAEACGANGGTIVNELGHGRTILLPTPSISMQVSDYGAGKAPPDPRAARVLPRISMDFVTDYDHFQPEELENSAFYVDFLRTRELGWHACARVAEGDGQDIYLSLKRAHRYGHYTREELRILNAALPSIRTAIVSTRAVMEAQAHARADVLGAHGEAVFELSAQGRILSMNDAATRLLREGTAIAAIGGRLLPVHPGDEKALAQLLGAALDRPGRMGSAVLAGVDTGQRLILRALPITGAARDVLGVASAVLVAAAWKAPTEPAQDVVAALRSAFGLTPMEARVAALVAAGVAPTLVATKLKIGWGTTRNHLKAAMAKAGVQRQAELAALVAAIRP